MTVTALPRLGAGLALLALVLLSSGCFNESQSVHVDLGSVSIGQQLMDLKAAREDEAISDAEYRKMRRKLIDAVNDIETGSDGDDASDDRAEEGSEDDDDFAWF